VGSRKQDLPRRLETRIKRGFPHSHSDGDGGLAGSYKTQHRIKSGPLTDSCTEPIFLSALVAYLPVPDFFSQVMGLIARVVPAANMGPLRNLMKDTILSRQSRLLTFGILFTLWSASSGFTALIDALNTAYDVSETRRYWKTRGLAILLTFSVGCPLVVALGMLLVGSSLGAWLTETFA
jgi:uncharacterized BrkB/YihY/UPF0761 family membrane protein